MKFNYIFLSILLISCTTTPISGKRALLLTSEDEENRMGEEAFKEVLRTEKRSEDIALTRRIESIGRRIARVANRPSYKWEFVTIEKNEPNAFCLPGGKIAVYTGILSIAKNDAGLAAIIGHEVAHAIARHAGQRMSTAQIANFGLAVVGTIGAAKFKDDSKKQLLFAALGIVGTTGFILPFSRANEYEADSIGTILMAKAGYDPREAVAIWERFSKLDNGKQPEFLSTHPYSEKRAKELRDMMPKAFEYYDTSPQKLGQGSPF